MKDTGRAVPERMVGESWPALHGRPVLRRTIAISLVLCISAAAALAIRGVNALTLGRGVIETDRDRAELLAGLHPSQHPGAGRYYVPVGAVYTHLADGAPVAYLHYRLVGGQDVGLGDFLRTYDLPAPGPSATLPADLAAALGGDEPAEALELAEPSPSPAPVVSDSPSSVPSPSLAPPPPPSPSPLPLPSSPSPEPTVTESPSPSPSPCTDDEESDDEATPEPSETPAAAHPSTGLQSADEPPPPATAPSPTETPTPTPTATPTPTPAAAPAPTRRIYVATTPSVPGAADIYVRATG
ncbi:hypothetical protein [Kitasatospora sp. NPDC047058]|uniref:hypothetical protein n=1 Tax=Kitasatospora sp. NPDC047058 TaxID=3155620 RepID=UPI0033D4B0AD